MKRFKKVYVEITNVCNLSCPFCIGNSRPKAFLSEEDFKIILLRLIPYTDYLYFHLMGEPLMHPHINRMIDMASQSFFVNITTNGYLIDRIAENPNIRQINISLHSFDESYDKSLDEYLERIFLSADKLNDHNTIINYRLWAHSKYAPEMIKRLNEKYHASISGNKKATLANNVYFDVEEQFIWPNVNNEFTLTKGGCRALLDHIGILVDGSVVPCCLDSNGDMAFGSIYKSSLDKIINSKPFQDMLEGFEKKKRVEKLCQKCNFYQK